MTDPFFRLEQPTQPHENIKDLNVAAELQTALSNSNDLRNAIYWPPTLAPEELKVHRSFFTKKTFTNVSFKDTHISGFEFRQCHFRDCLFIDAVFDNCEFHQCTFEGSNPHKKTLNKTYIDPTSFEGIVNKKNYSNVGIHLFHELYDNAIKTNQPRFARAAEFNMRKWERYDFDRKHPKLCKFKGVQFFEWLANVLSWIFVGYGIRAKFWMAWASFFCALAVLINYIFWDSLAITDATNTIVQRDLIDVCFYTLTTFGAFNVLAPTSDIGKIVFVGQTGFGLFVFALFVRWLLRLAMR